MIVIIITNQTWQFVTIVDGYIIYLRKIPCFTHFVQLFSRVFLCLSIFVSVFSVHCQKKGHLYQSIYKPKALYFADT